MNYAQSTTLERYSIAFVVAFGVTSILFFVMQAAIAEGDVIYDPAPPFATVNMVRTLEDRPIVEPEQTIRKPPPVEEMPEPPIMPRTFDGQGGGTFVVPKPRPVVDTTPRGTGSGEGDLLPIMRVAPEYPQRAAMQGTEGWVIVEFIVDELGRVLKPRVVDAHPTGVFDRAALKAVLRYKYKPRVLNGEPQAVDGVRQRIVFSLNS